MSHVTAVELDMSAGRKLLGILIGMMLLGMLMQQLLVWSGILAQAAFEHLSSVVTSYVQVKTFLLNTAV